MPGTVITADKLPELATAANIEMRGYGETPDALEIGVCLPVQLVGEQLLHFIAAVLTWRQTDRMQHDQISAIANWTLAGVGGRQVCCKPIPAIAP